MPETAAAARRRGVWPLVKGVLDLCCLAAVAPCGLLSALEARIGPGESMFGFWAQAFAIVPGPPGVALRRAFYRWTLERCDGSFYVGFGAMFSHRSATVEDGVYIGPYAIVGSSRLREGCLIGSRTGIVSGSALHELDAQGRRLPTDARRLRRVEIGAHAWIGEGCLILGDIGPSAVVAAGSVVSGAVRPGVVVAGNPARFVRTMAAHEPREGECVSEAV